MWFEGLVVRRLSENGGFFRSVVFRVRFLGLLYKVVFLESLDVVRFWGNYSCYIDGGSIFKVIVFVF